jgi:hypothetical protein
MAMNKQDAALLEEIGKLYAAVQPGAPWHPQEVMTTLRGILPHIEARLRKLALKDAFKPTGHFTVPEEHYEIYGYGGGGGGGVGGPSRDRSQRVVVSRSQLEKGIVISVGDGQSASLKIGPKLVEAPKVEDAPPTAPPFAEGYYWARWKNWPSTAPTPPDVFVVERRRERWYQTGDEQEIHDDSIVVLDPIGRWPAPEEPKPEEKSASLPDGYYWVRRGDKTFISDRLAACCADRPWRVFSGDWLRDDEVEVLGPVRGFGGPIGAGAGGGSDASPSTTYDATSYEELLAKTRDLPPMTPEQRVEQSIDFARQSKEAWRRWSTRRNGSGLWPTFASR